MRELVKMGLCAVIGVFVIFVTIVVIEKLAKENTNSIYSQRGQRIDCGVYEIKIIDGCEYIAGSGVLTHKGHCTNHVGRANEDK